MARKKSAQKRDKTRASTSPDPEAFPGLIAWLAGLGIDQGDLARAIGRDQSTVSRLLIACGGLIDGLKKMVARHRPQYLAALADPRSGVIRDLRDIALFDVGLFAAPAHIEKISELYGVARTLETMLSPGQVKLVEQVLKKNRKVVLFGPDTDSNREEFRSLCLRLLRIGVPIKTLSWIAGPRSSLGIGLTPTAIVNPREDRRMGVVGMYHHETAELAALAFVLAGQCTREIALSLVPIEDEVDHASGAFTDASGGRWERIEATTASQRR